MQTDTVLLLFILATNSILAVVLFILGVSYIRLLHKLGGAEKERQQLAANMQEKTTQVLDEARQRAVKIIQEANEKAQHILTGSSELDEAAKQMVLQKLQTLAQQESRTFDRSTEDITKAYAEMLAKLRQDHINMLNTLSKDIEQKALGEIQQFTNTLEQGTVGTQKLLEQKMQEEYKTLLEQLALYKEQRMAKIDDAIYKVIQMVAVEVIGKTLTLEDHQQLVLEALSNAKQELSMKLQLEEYALKTQQPETTEEQSQT